MKRSLISLKREATMAVQWRGHILKRWQTGVSIYQGYAECRVCGMSVHVDTNPQPNGIDIGGEAVALTCRLSPFGWLANTSEGTGASPQPER